MAPNVDITNSQSHPDPQQQRRCFRFRQLKKILPSDHISIEKNYPKFYEKCKNLKLLRQFQDRQEDQRVSQWAAVEKSFMRRHSQYKLSISDTVRPLEEPESKAGNSNVIGGDNQIKFGAQSFKDSLPTANPEIKMADHIDELTLQKGCWLQAKLNFADNFGKIQDKEVPRVVFVHRKQSPTEIRPRCQLAREVLAEFEREKRRIQIQMKTSIFPATSWIFAYDNLSRRVS